MVGPRGVDLDALPTALRTLRDARSAAARVSACNVLAGAVGLPAIRALVEALDDNDGDVRRAALTALARSAVGEHALRLVHAVCHRRLDVRLGAAVLEGLPAPLVALALADATVHDAATDTLRRRLTREPALVDVVLRARRAGHLDEDRAIEALTAVAWTSCGDVLRALPPAGSYRVDAPHQIGDDLAVDLLMLVAKQDALSEAFARGVHTAMARGAIDEPARRRLAACVALLLPSGVPPVLLAVAAAAEPHILALAPFEDARAAGLLLVGPGNALHTDVFAAAAVPRHSAELAYRAGLLRLCRENPYMQLLASVDVDVIVSAWQRAPEPALVALPPTSADDRAALIRLLLRLIDRAPIDIAALLLVTAADPHPVLSLASSPDTALALLRAALELDNGNITRAGLSVAVLEMRSERAFTLLARRLTTALPEAIAAALAAAGDDARGNLNRHAQTALRVLCNEASPLDLHAVVERNPSCAVRVVAQLPHTVDADSVPPGALRTALEERAEALQVRALTDDERRLIFAAPNSAEATWAMIRGRRRRGVTELLGRVPATLPALCALLASHDPLHDVAAAVARLERLPTDRDVIQALRPHLARLPLAAVCAVIVAEAAAGADLAEALSALRLEVASTPSGLRGVLGLAAEVSAPLGPLLVTAAHLLALDDRNHANERVLDAARRAAVQAPRETARALEAFIVAFAPRTAATRLGGDELHPVFHPDEAAFQRWLAQQTIASLQATAEMLLAHGDVPAARLVEVVRASATPSLVSSALESTGDAEAHQALLRLLPSSTMSSSSLSSSSSASSVPSSPLDALQAAAAWGATTSLALVGRPIAVSYVGDTLGYTRIGSSSIHINPLPLLLGERRGDDIVRGLIAHELGHHRYHGHPEDLAVWQQAQREQLGPLLNLVADEHLERNLRALSSSRYGDRLHALAAWAFQHRRKPFRVSALLNGLGSRAASVLIGGALSVAADPQSVVVEVGGLIGRLQARGSRFARFMHALRMGKSVQHDPVVERALVLCRGPRFRHLRLSGLLQLARRLRDLFADEKSLPELLDLHALTDASARELAASGVPLDELQRRGANTSPREQSTRLGPRPRHAVDNASFAPITQIERVPFDATAARQQVAAAARGAQRLRRTFQHLGEQHHVVKHRSQGQRLDRGNLGRQVVLRDPRLLTARTSARLANVAIVVLIDCSGSMVGARLQRAQRFAATLAAAAVGVRGVDVRFAGFTDTTIFDAGTADRCAVAGLVGNGGNNDAAALSWATTVVLRLPRQHRLIVMISDDAPTECSPAAVRHVVNRAAARGISCLQVAVAPIGTVCFPRHVLLDADDVDDAARRFAHVLARGVLEHAAHAAPRFVDQDTSGHTEHSDAWQATERHGLESSDQDDEDQP